MKHRPDLGLQDVLTSAAGALGAPGFTDIMGIGSSSLVVVCLIDGLAATAIEGHPDLFPHLASAGGGSIEAPFPTTTATGLVTLGTGLLPGQHGIVGAAFRLPETEEILSPLRWGSSPSPIAVQPEPTVFERVQEAGVTAVCVGPRQYANSGLTRAAFRGSEYHDAESIGDRVRVIADLDGMAKRSPVLAYAYWPALDRAGHEFGIDSAQWRDAATDVDRLIAEMRATIGSHGSLIVTADHGMVDTQQRIWIDDVPDLQADVNAIAGEPRMRHLYTDQSDAVIVRWSRQLGTNVTLMTRTEAIGEGIFGPVDPFLAERIGDVIAMPSPGVILASRRFDDLVSRLPGQHGGLTDDERRIPGLLV